MSASFCDCVNQWEQAVGLQVLKDTKYLSLRTRGDQRWGDENNTRAAGEEEGRWWLGWCWCRVSGVAMSRRWWNVRNGAEQIQSQCHTTSSHNRGLIETQCAHGNAETWHLQTTHCIHPSIRCHEDEDDWQFTRWIKHWVCIELWTLIWPRTCTFIGKK